MDVERKGKNEERHKVREKDTNINCPPISAGEIGYRILGKPPSIWTVTQFRQANPIAVISGSCNCANEEYRRLACGVYNKVDIYGLSKEFSATIFKVNFCRFTERHNADGPLKIKINRSIAMPDYSYMDTGQEAL